jgi:transglutaminase-like putative cysteine protease
MDLTPFLTPTPTVDSDHPAVIDYAQRISAGHNTPRERVIALYYAVRDGIRYDGYELVLTVHGLSASRTLEQKRGWCVSKAVLLAACCRVVGVPARLGYADVKNHLSTQRMREQMGTDEFYYHGYTDILVDGVWRKATPAFNIELCRKFRIKPLEFDGGEDSIYHPFDEDGKRHMEYLRYRGEFADVPLDEMKREFAIKYPHIHNLRQGDFAREVDQETGQSQ